MRRWITLLSSSPARAGRGEAGRVLGGSFCPTIKRTAVWERRHPSFIRMAAGLSSGGQHVRTLVQAAGFTAGAILVMSR